MKPSWVLVLSSLMVAGVLGHAPQTLRAQAVQNPLAVFAGLDKITGRITTFEIPVNEVRRFGALNVYPRICNSRPPTEEPKTTSFVQVDENLLSGGTRRIFSGWMLAESPGLNAVEHPVYDVWLIGCRDPNRKSVDDEQSNIPPAQNEPPADGEPQTAPQE